MDICVIGGSNIDIAGISKNKVNLKDSNIGEIYFTPGGVARNICENLARLEKKVKFISVFADDFYSSKLKETLIDLDVDITHSLNVKNARTSTYLFISDNNGDMVCAINDMDIYKKLDVDFLKTKIDVINSCSVCVFDTNIGNEEIKYLVNNVKIPIIVDPVSFEKGKKILPYLDKIYAFKPNKLEALEYTLTDSVEKASKKLLEKGVKNVFISLGSKGLYYENKDESGVIKALDLDVVNTTGSGDTLTSAIAYGFSNNYSIKETSIFGVSASQLCVLSEDTVSKEMNIKNVEKMIKEVKNGSM